MDVRDFELEELGDPAAKFSGEISLISFKIQACPYLIWKLFKPPIMCDNNLFDCAIHTESMVYVGLKNIIHSILDLIILNSASVPRLMPALPPH